MRLRTILTTIIILFWGVMMGAHLSWEYNLLPRGINSSTISDPDEYRSRFLSRDQVVAYELLNDDGTVIGNVQRRVKKKEDRARVTQSLTIYLARLSSMPAKAGTLVMNKTSRYDSNGELQGFELVLKLDRGSVLRKILEQVVDENEIRITGTRLGDRLKVRFDNLGIEKFVDFSSFIQVPDSFNPIGAIVPPEPGSSRRISIMDPLRNKLLTLNVHTLRQPVTRSWKGTPREMHEVRITEEGGREGLKGTAWITPEGIIVRQKIRHPFLPTSLTFVRTTSLPSGPSR